MNKQVKMKNGVVTGRGIEWTNWTWNPTSGCFHDCKWEMPSGDIASCYAGDVANKFTAAYPNGFEHHYWHPHRLVEPERVKEAARIFVGSMADVFGHWVLDSQIEAILEVCRRVYWHTFQFLTKNIVRVKEFAEKGLIPKNCWIGASTPPDEMWGKKLTERVKRRMFSVMLKALGELKKLGVLTWISAEPYSQDYVQEMEENILSEGVAAFDWIVIGAASDGPRYFPPKHEHVVKLVAWLKAYKIPTFFKGNLKSLSYAAENWREEFPVGVTA